MKLSNVTEYGCYMGSDGEAIYQVMPNTDKIWLEEEPDVKVVVDTFYLAYRCAWLCSSIYRLDLVCSPYRHIVQSYRYSK